MDRDPPFSFDAGDSGLQSDAGTGERKSPGSDAGIAGRIDPAIARATAEAGSVPALAAPSGASGGDNNTSDGNANNATGGTTGPAGKRRGRHPADCTCANCEAKRTQGPTASLGDAKERNVRASFVTRTLQIAHLIVSKAANAPELELDADDAKMLGEATAEVLKFYKVKMTAKQEAYALLIEAAAQVYPPMFVSLYIRKMAEAEERKKRQPPPPQPSRDPAASAFRPGVSEPHTNATSFVVPPIADGKWQP